MIHVLFLLSISTLITRGIPLRRFSVVPPCLVTCLLVLIVFIHV